MLLDFNKPKKIMSEEERIDKYSSDSGVPGTYVPNMSSDDMKKWKGKYIKGKDERVEIRKTISGTQLVVIVYKEEKYEEVEYFSSKETYMSLVHKNVHISANGKILLSFDEYKELLQVVEEAISILNNKEDMDNKEDINNELQVRLNKLLKDLSNLPYSIKSNLNSLEIDTDISVVKIPNKEGFSYAIRHSRCGVYSKYDKAFYIEPSPSNRDEDFYKEFRFDTIEEAILAYMEK